MPKLQISGKILYNDTTPASTATVEIWDLDLGPDGRNDKILSRTTNDQGHFSGLSTEWRDREGIVFGVPLPDILNLEFHVTVPDGRTHKGPFVVGQGTSIPIVLPFPPPKPVQKSERDLVQVIYLSDGLAGGERALYEFIEASSEGVVAVGLGLTYRRIHVLKGDDATLPKFKSTLQAAATAAGVDVVDVMFNTHGSTNKVYFKDGPKTERAVKDALDDLSASVRGKFRAVFSTACFGATHRDMWTSIGFRATCGAKGTYADSAVSFAPLVARWASEGTFQETVDVANAADLGSVADNLAKNYYNAKGLPDRAEDVDSTRVIAGNGGIRIYSTP